MNSPDSTVCGDLRFSLNAPAFRYLRITMDSTVGLYVGFTLYIMITAFPNLIDQEL